MIAAAHDSLEVSEQCFHWVEEGGVLSGQENISLKVARNLVDRLALVDGGVVHVDDDPLLTGLRVPPEGTEGLVHEVAEESCVRGTLGQLSRNHLGAGDGCHQTKRELLAGIRGFPPSDVRHDLVKLCLAQAHLTIQGALDISSDVGLLS